MLSKKIVSFVLPLAIIFSGCSKVQDSPAGQRTALPDSVKLESSISGAKDETRVAAFVFEQPITIKEATEATSQHQVNVLSAKFYIDGVTGTTGNAQSQSPQETFANLSLSLASNVKTSLQDDRDTIAPNLLQSTNKESEASEQWQMEAVGLLDRARQREAITEVLQNKRAAIYTVTLQGKVEKLRAFAKEFKLEGIANIEFGSTLTTPKPQSVQLQETSTLKAQQATLSTADLRRQVEELVQKTLGPKMSNDTAEVSDDSLELAPTSSDQSFANRGSLNYRSPGYISAGKVRFDEVNIYAYWDRPGDWNYPYSGVELDFNVYTRYLYGGCTASTNLPTGYNDCPTAGVSEANRSYIGLGFGAFVARQIRAGYRYYGYLDLYTNGYYRSGTTFDWNVGGQETALISGCLRPTDIWCRQSKAGKSLVTNPNFRTGSSGSASWR